MTDKHVQDTADRQETLTATKKTARTKSSTRLISSEQATSSTTRFTPSASHASSLASG